MTDITATDPTADADTEPDGARSPEIETDDGPTFEQLGLNAALLKSIKDVGYEAPTPIQIEVIPALLAGRDVIAQAQTGSGKTAAFGLPDHRGDRSQAALGAGADPGPTRELAIQVAEALHKYGRHKDVETLPIYGGQPYERQFRGLQRGVQIVVGTPGRVMDHMRRGTLKLDDVRFFVLDEADEMLDMGFIEDIEWILEQAPAERQTALFSATMPPRIADLASRYMREPQRITVAGKEMTVPQIRQSSYEVPRARKVDALTRILDAETPQSAMIFCRTKRGVDELGEALMARGYAVETLHGDLSQAQRDRVMRRFRAGQAEVLIATDVAARGLDIPDVSPRHQLRHPGERRGLRPPHRPHRPRRASRRGDHAGHAARGALAAPDRAHHPRPHRAAPPADAGRRRRAPPRRAEAADPRRARCAGRRLRRLPRHHQRPGRRARRRRDRRGDPQALRRGDRPHDDPGAAGRRHRHLRRGRAAGARSARRGGHGPPVHQRRAATRARGRRTSSAPSPTRPASPGRAIGAIDIFDDYTFVDIPREFVDRVLAAMRGARIKGRPVNAEVARMDGAPGPRDRGGRGAGSVEDGHRSSAAVASTATATIARPAATSGQTVPSAAAHLASARAATARRPHPGSRSSRSGSVRTQRMTSQLRTELDVTAASFRSQIATAHRRCGER